MVARAVTKVWQESLDGPPSIGRVHQARSVDPTSSKPSMGWSFPEEEEGLAPVANDEANAYPQLRIAKKPKRIVPKRRATRLVEPPSDSLWQSYEFWMGIVIGASVVVVIKTVLAVQAPFGVGWY